MLIFIPIAPVGDFASLKSVVFLACMATVCKDPSCVDMLSTEFIVVLFY